MSIDVSRDPTYGSVGRLSTAVLLLMSFLCPENGFTLIFGGRRVMYDDSGEVTALGVFVIESPNWSFSP